MTACKVHAHSSIISICIPAGLDCMILHIMLCICIEIPKMIILGGNTIWECKCKGEGAIYVAILKVSLREGVRMYMSVVLWRCLLLARGLGYAPLGEKKILFGLYGLVYLRQF